MATALPAPACYTGLGIIPTADTIKPGAYGVEMQFDGRLAGATAHTRLLNTQFGLLPRFEAGVDFDISGESDSRRLLNAKYLLLSDCNSCPSLAIGVCNVGTHIRSSPYAVASHDFGVLRAHLGSMRIDGRTCWCAGVDRAITSKFTLMVDYTSGQDNFASVGGSYQFSQHFGIMAAVELPNDKSGNTDFTTHLLFN
ncbi:MAG: hypothetical protein A2Z18_06105 [Armatimonadetes bacterium RBG_16_58_9]|nr:MAG: hypothetical protein A2Z18_06105 [Armatimonadetes bacterium RBG_16_58_9]